MCLRRHLSGGLRWDHLRWDHLRWDLQLGGRNRRHPRINCRRPRMPALLHQPSQRAPHVARQLCLLPCPFRGLHHFRGRRRSSNCRSRCNRRGRSSRRSRSILSSHPRHRESTPAKSRAFRGTILRRRSRLFAATSGLPRRPKTRLACLQRPCLSGASITATLRRALCGRPCTTCPPRRMP